MNKIVLTNQQERFLIFALQNTPKKYSKAAICQCLSNECNLDDKSISRVMGVGVSYVQNCIAACNVTPWSERPEKTRLTNYIKPRVKEAKTNIKLFLITGTESGPIYLVTTDGKSPDQDSKILHSGYLNIHKRQDAKYKARAADYTEVDILVTEYASMRVSDIIKKLR